MYPINRSISTDTGFNKLIFVATFLSKIFVEEFEGGKISNFIEIKATYQNTAL